MSERRPARTVEGAGGVASEAASDLYVVVAAYNEGAVIGDTVRELVRHFPSTVVVDDGSEDDTSQQAADAGATVLRHPINLGQGAALQTGMTFSLRRGAKYIATFDADGQHSPSDVHQMLEALQAAGADIVLGSRFLGEAPGIPFGRKLFLKAAILFTNITTGVKLTDTHNGLRVMTADAARKLKITQSGMAHASEFIEQIKRLRLKHLEVPVRIHYTSYSLRKGQNVSNALRILTDVFSSKVMKW